MGRRRKWSDDARAGPNKDVGSGQAEEELAKMNAF